MPPGDFVAKLHDTYAVGIDPTGKCRWDTDMTSTEHVIMVLTESVPAEHLDHLRRAGVSYVLGGKRLEFWRLFGRRRDIRVQAGPPLDLSEFDGGEPTKETLDRATDRILDPLTAMRAELTGLTPPEGRFDMRQGRRVPVAHPDGG